MDIKICTSPWELSEALDVFMKKFEVKYIPPVKEEYKYPMGAYTGTLQAFAPAIKQLYDDVEEKEPEEPKKPEPKKGGSKRKVDRGKIMSLYEGKWTIKDIAADVKCSEQTVRNVIKEELTNAEK